MKTIVASICLLAGFLFPNVVAFVQTLNDAWHHCPPTTTSGALPVYGHRRGSRKPLYAGAGSKTVSKIGTKQDDSNSTVKTGAVVDFVEGEQPILSEREDSRGAAGASHPRAVALPPQSPPPPESSNESDDETNEKEKSDSSAAALDVLESIEDAAISVTLQVLSALRWGAATVLTASLPDLQRNELLNRMSAKGTAKPYNAIEAGIKQGAGNEGESPARGSVQEETAAAVVKETRGNQQKWEKEKEALVKQMEAAAKERVKNELAVQKQRMEKEQQILVDIIEAEKKQLEIQKMLLEKAVDTGGEIKELESLLKKRQSQQDKLDSVEGRLRERVVSLRLEKENLSKMVSEIEEIDEKQGALNSIEGDSGTKKPIPNVEAETVETEDGSVVDGEQRDEAHPVLGPIISDLGYKRIHLVSSAKLGTVPVWNKNRIYRNERAKAMAVDKMKTMHLGFPGVICVFEDAEGKLSILDGQHRVGMMASIREKRNLIAKDSDNTFDADRVFDQVLVEVYPQRGESAEKLAEQIFVEINKAESVKL
jgi:hypothetical protein